VSPVGIAAFNLGELIALSVIAHLALLAVPNASRLSDAQSGSLVQKVVMMAVGLGYLGVVYSFSVSIDKDPHRSAPPGAEPARRVSVLNIAIPLLLTSLATAFATFNDLMRWRGKGGIFVPQYAMSAAPKILTLIIAPIPAVLIAKGYAKADLATGLLVWSARVHRHQDAVRIPDPGVPVLRDAGREAQARGYAEPRRLRPVAQVWTRAPSV
jgi:hypothetical protein